MCPPSPSPTPSPFFPCILHDPPSPFQTAEFFDTVISAGADPQIAANWLTGDVTAALRNIKAASILDCQLTPLSLAELIKLISDGTISGKIAKEVRICCT